MYGRLVLPLAHFISSLQHVFSSKYPNPNPRAD